MNTRKTSHRNKAVPAPESEGSGSGGKIAERKQTTEALRCNYDFLLALSLAAQSVQQARTPEDIYHTLGREIKALGCDLVIFTCSEDRKRLHITHTTLAADLLHAAEKLTGIQTQDYLLPIQPESVFARVIDGGNAEFLQQTELDAIRALPKALHPLAEQLVTFLKVGRGIVAPLRVDAATVGVMAITGSNLEESNVPAVASFAAQVAISLKNVRLTRQLQEELEERKRTEEQLQLLKYSIDIAPDGAYWMDKDGRFLYANEAGCRALGYTNEELMQMRISEVNLRATPERWSQVWREIKEKKSIEIRSAHRRKDGSEFPVELTSTYVEFGKREYCNGFAKDITERMQAEEAVKLSEARYRSLVETQSDLISRSELSGNLSFVNDAYCRIFGVRREQALGGSFIPTVFPEDIPDILNALEGIKHPPHRKYIEIRNITPDGIRWFGWDNSAVLDEQQNIIELQGVGRDITERKQVEEALVESEKKFRALFETMSEGIVYQDHDGKIISANPAAEMLLGLSFDQMQGRTSVDPRWKAIHEDGSPFPGETHSLNVAAKTGKPAIDEVMGIYNPKSNAYVWLSVNSTPEFLPGEKKPFRAYAVFRDITEQMRAEHALMESESLYRKMNENSPLGMHFYKLNNNDQLVFVGANPAANKLLGVDHSQFIGKTIEEAFPPLNQTEVPECYRDAAAKGIPWSTEQITYEDKQITGAFEVRAFQTTPGNMVAVFADITERKQAEEKLRENEQTLRSFIANSPDTMYLLDLESHTSRYLNCDEFCGYPRSTLESPASIMFALHADDGPAVRANWQQMLQASDDDVTSCEYRLQSRDGNWEWIQQRMTILTRTADGKPSQVLVTLSIITERKQAETKLKESEENFRLIAETIREVFYIYDPLADKFLYVSPAYETLWQEPVRKIYDDPRSFTYAVHAEDRERFSAAVQREREGGEYFNMQYRIVRPDGTMRHVHSRNYPVFDASGAEYRVVGISEDITIWKRAEEEILKLNIELEQRVEDRTHELRQAQEQLVRQEKLAVLGQLAGSVGHELRNPLAVIKNALYYLKIVEANGNEKVREYLGIIESEARTAEKIINDLLEFARVKAMDLEAVPASRLVEYVLERYPAPGNVRVRVNIPANLPMLYIDPRQMEQVLGNLFVNACQAMGSGGDLVITAHEEQGMVAIAVRDTGGGILPENIGRLFEPLFTTKSKGIGLGLAVSRKLIEANGGRIEVQSEVGIGTTFTVYLPVKHDKHVEDIP